MTETLLGDHVVSGSRNNYNGRLYRGVISFEHGAIDKSLGEVKEDCFTVWRNIDQYGINNADIPPGFNNFDEEQARANARYWWYDSLLRQYWDNHPASAYKLTNETGANDEKELRALVAFEQEFIKLNEEAGSPYTFLVASCAGDSPNWDLKLWQNVIAPHAKFAWEHGHIYSRHAYCDAGPYGTDRMIINGQPSTPNTERPFLEFRWFIDNYGYCGPLVIGECGFVTYPNDAIHYVREISAYDEYAMNYEYKSHRFIDSCGFMACFTDGNWVNANKQDANPLLNQYLTAKPYSEWIPSGGIPVEKPKIVIAIAPQVHNMTEEENIQVAEWCFKTYGRTYTHSHDDMLTMLAAGNDQSYAVVWWPERQADIIQMLQDAGYSYITMPEQPTEPPNILDVVTYDQCDSRWASKLCGYGPKTLCQWGCLLTVYTMLGDYWDINNGRLVDSENTHYKNNGGFSGQNLISMAMAHVYHNVKHEGWIIGGSAMHNKIKEYLANGNPVAARVDFNPATPQYEQHWVLLVGYDAERNDYLMNNPWKGTKGVYVKDHYPGGLLEAIFYYLDDDVPSPEPFIDTHDYFVPTGQYGIQIVVNTGDGTQPMQLEKRADDVILRKGDGNWIDGKRYQDSEQWRVTGTAVEKGVDVSDAGNDGKDAYNLHWAQWIPRYVQVGKQYHSTPLVTRFNRTNCQIISEKQGNDYLYIKELVPQWTSPANPNIKLTNVLVIEWRSGTNDLSVPATETYYLCRNIGYVGWGSHFISEMPLGREPLSGKLDSCFQ